MKTQYHYKTIYKIGISLFVILLPLASCEDFVDTDIPKDEIVIEEVFSNDAAAISAISGVYSEMMRTGFASGNTTSITILAGLSADELMYVGSGSSILEFYENLILSTNGDLQRNLWESMYKHIFNVNSVLEGLNNSVEITETVRNQLEGEAKFIRAFCYFYLVNLFGEVPLITSTDFESNSKASREDTAIVYDQIIEDLGEASSLLSEDYSLFDDERVRANKWAAEALLARVYLFLEDWPKAETHASAVIDKNSLYSLKHDLNEVFLANSTEAIWQLKPVRPERNTNEGDLFILTQATGAQWFLSEEFIDSFEDNDSRKTQWTDSITDNEEDFLYYAHKYKMRGPAPLTEYSMVIRLAEMYLISAEANAQQGDLSNAIADIDVLRKRANLPLITNINPGIDQPELLDIIIQERRVELFTEWGHRWLDLKRTRRADSELSTKKQNWQSTDVLYPIPQSEINANPNLLPQNEGY